MAPPKFTRITTNDFDGKPLEYAPFVGDDKKTVRVRANEVYFVWFEDHIRPALVKFSNVIIRPGCPRCLEETIEHVLVTYDEDAQTFTVRADAEENNVTFIIPVSTMFLNAVTRNPENVQGGFLEYNMVSGTSSGLPPVPDTTIMYDDVKVTNSLGDRITVNIHSTTKDGKKAPVPRYIRSFMCTGNVTDTQFVKDECVYNPETQTFKVTFRCVHDRTLKVSTHVYIPHIATDKHRGYVSPFACYVKELTTRQRDVHLLRSQCVALGLPNGRYKAFETKHELKDKIYKSFYEVPFQEVCATYGPFFLWDVSKVDDLSNVFNVSACYSSRNSIQNVFSKLHLPLKREDDKGEEETQKRHVLCLKGWTFPPRIQSMQGMFKGCDFLHAIYMPRDLPLTFTQATSHHVKVVDMSEMFQGCASLKTLSFDATVHVPVYHATVDCSDMFSGCTSLTSTGLTVRILQDSERQLSEKPLVNMKLNNMFYDCINLGATTIHLGGDVKTIFTCRSMFENCVNMTNSEHGTFQGTALPLAGDKLRRLVNICDATRMFYNCHGLQDLPYNSLRIIKKGINTPDLYHLVVDGKEGCTNMFANCFSLKDSFVQHFLDINPLTDNKVPVDGMFAITEEFNRLVGDPAVSQKHRYVSVSLKFERSRYFTCIQAYLARVFSPFSQQQREEEDEEIVSTTNRNVRVPWTITCKSANDVKHSVADPMNHRVVHVTSEEGYVVVPCTCIMSDSLPAY